MSQALNTSATNPLIAISVRVRLNAIQIAHLIRRMQALHPHHGQTKSEDGYHSLPLGEVTLCYS